MYLYFLILRFSFPLRHGLPALEMACLPRVPSSSSSSYTHRHYSSENRSFVMNAFVGKMETAELFPYPDGTKVDAFFTRHI